MNKKKSGGGSFNRTPNNTSRTRPFYSPYLSNEDISHGLKRGELLEGILRINAKNYERAYIDNPETGESVDILISGMADRNRALNGDLVAVRLKEKGQWKVMNPSVNGQEDNQDNSHTKLSFSETPTDATGVKFGLGDADAECTPEIGSRVSMNEMKGRPVFDKVISSQLGPDFLDPYGSPPSSRNSSQPDGMNNHSAIKDTISKVAMMEVDGDMLKMNISGASLCNLASPSFANKFNSSVSSLAPGSPLVTLNNLPSTSDASLQKTAEINASVHDLEPDAISVGAIIRQLSRSLGMAGEVEPETEGMLLQLNIDTSDFAKDVIDCLPKVPTSGAWSVPKEELEYRRDFRHECVFTIDPTTARDLDDALHVKPIDDGLFEVGVHIADVSYFIEPATALDKVAFGRATSVYLVHKVIPMLPRLLCEELCSLNPGVDRLTFSVVWKMDVEGNAYEEWFGRSVIKSCCKLTYDYAQNMIVDQQKNWTTDELPPISGTHTPGDIATCVHTLHKMAMSLRSRRYSHGALNLNQPKLSFALSAQTGLPIGCSTYPLRDSNRMIEEFMLLANMAVAHQLYKKSKDTAVLRKHDPPKPKVLTDSIELCNALGFPISGTDAGSIHESLYEYRQQAEQGDERTRIAMPVLVQMLSKPMVLADYFCPGVISDPSRYRHYALSVPLYTHFTSPIRRYPDIMVHRILAYTLGYSEQTALQPKQIQSRCLHCNERKTSAKAAGDLSSELFFKLFVKHSGSVEDHGVIMGILDHAVDILLSTYGVIRRSYVENQEDILDFVYADAVPPSITLRWDAQPTPFTQCLTICDEVDVVLTPGPKKLEIIESIIVLYVGDEAELTSQRRQDNPPLLPF